SNWYLRRSRARFWRGARANTQNDTDAADKRAAYHTTHACLQTVARLMAPIAPFFADWLYQQVTRGEGALSSVHAADFPQPDAAVTDVALERRMALARAIVGNVLALRNRAGINVRQPLARILVVEETAVAREDVEAVAAVIRDEVNIDAIEFVAGTGDLVTRSAKPNYPVLGRRLGPMLKAVAAAVAGLSDEAISSYMVDKALDLEIGGEPVTLGEDDLLISAEGVAGWLVGREDG